MRLTALATPIMSMAERKDGDWSAADAAPFLVRSGDFMLARGNGSLKLVGRGALVGAVNDSVAFPDTMIRIRPNLSLLNPAYLALVWNSRVVRRQIELAARTTAGIYKINQRDVAEIRLPIPSMRAQDIIVERLTTVADASARATDAAESVLRRGENLRRALLAAAFSGKLTGHEASDAERIEELALA